MNSISQFVTALCVFGGAFGAVAYSMEEMVHYLLVFPVLWLCK